MAEKPLTRHSSSPTKPVGRTRKSGAPLNFNVRCFKNMDDTDKEKIAWDTRREYELASDELRKLHGEKPV